MSKYCPHQLQKLQITLRSQGKTVIPLLPIQRRDYAARTKYGQLVLPTYHIVHHDVLAFLGRRHTRGYTWRPCYFLEEVQIGAQWGQSCSVEYEGVCGVTLSARDG